MLNRASWVCEWCGKPDRQEVYSAAGGLWCRTGEVRWHDSRGRPCDPPQGDVRVAFCVLQVAHLDHEPTNNDPRNLAALCARCHTVHDRQQHRATQRERLNNQELFE